MNKKNNLLLVICSLVLFFSCETEGQITGDDINPSQNIYQPSDDDGNGFIVGQIENLYYDLLGDQSYNQDFWKFNWTHFNGATHCGPNPTSSCIPDILNLSTYNNSFYVPPEAFDPNAGAIVYIYNPLYDSNDPNSDEYISFDSTVGPEGFDDLSDLTTEIQGEPELTTISSEISLKTPPITVSSDPIEKIMWSIGENMYKYTTMSPIRDTVTFPYEYDYNLFSNFVPLDTLQNPILDDVVIVLDTAEIGDSLRYYNVYDTVLTNNEIIPILINREHTFYSYVNELNGDYTQRQSTDCNDNYQKDGPEIIIDYFEDDCILNGGVWQTNSNDPCSSICNLNNKTMQDLCWEVYDNDLRLTGHCAIGLAIGSAFCDSGNNLYDNAEVLYDACFGDCDGDGNNIDIIGQGVEPWEDRNCNSIYDSDPELIVEGINNELDCNVVQYASWDTNYDGGTGICFYDRGNQKWDDEETCYGDFPSCNYAELYKRGFAPNYLMVSYENQDSPLVLSTIFSGEVYKDCGNDMLCNEYEFGYDSGTCSDGYSGTEELCCKHNLCWDYLLNTCDLSLPDCALPISGGWFENLDPNNDDCTNCPVLEGGFPNGEERNFQYDSGEFVIKDSDGDQSYSSTDTFVTKFLNYSDCDQNPDNCGGDLFEIISDGFEVASSSGSLQKLEAEAEVSSYKIVGQLPNMNLGNLNIVKTQWPNDDESDGESEDYMLFVSANNTDQNNLDYIVKLIQPYFYYANTPYSSFPTDYIDYDQDKWWQQLAWEQDTLIYSLDGDILDEQRRYSTYSVVSDTANYVVHKEYDVSVANANMTYGGVVIEDCILITRTITLTMIGPGFDYKFKSETYLKENYPIVKEIISWSWPPTFGGSRQWSKISSIEFKEDSDIYTSFLNNIEPIDLQNLQEYEEFDYSPFRISNTIGLQRFIIPAE